MAPGDSKAAELARMKNRLLEIEAQLKEERKTTARLRDQSEKKLQQIALVDAEIAAEVERFRWKREEILFNMRTIENETNQKLDGMKEEERAILEEISEFDILQYENEKLHTRLKIIASEQKENAQSQISERERRKQKDFDIRMAMEEMLRKTIKNVDESYEREAIAKMHMEASLANVENDRIHREFDLREAQTEELIRQQQYSYEELMKIKIEKDVIEISSKILEKNIQKLSNQNVINEKALTDLQAQVDKRRDEIQALKLVLENKVTLEQECQLLEEKCEEISQEKEKFRKLSLELCQKLLKESFKISSKQRINQNSEISKQLDDLSSHEDHSRGYQEDLTLDLPTPLPSHRSGPRTHSSRGKTESLPNLSPQPGSAYDPSLIWRLPQQQKRTLKQLFANGKEKQIKIRNRTTEPSFSMGDLNY